MAAQPAGAGDGEKAEFTLIHADANSLNKSVIAALLQPHQIKKAWELLDVGRVTQRKPYINN